MGDNELSCEAATLPTVCGKEETREDDPAGMKAEALQTVPERRMGEQEGKRAERKAPADDQRNRLADVMGLQKEKCRNG